MQVTPRQITDFVHVPNVANLVRSSVGDGPIPITGSTVTAGSAGGSELRCYLRELARGVR